MKTETPIPEAAINCPLHRHHNSVPANVALNLEVLAGKLKTAMSRLHEMYQTPVEKWRENPELQGRNKSKCMPLLTSP
jgi:hypothetical protein